jgi:hypothetical protein
MTNLISFHPKMLALANALYSEIIALPREVRLDDKERTGIAIFMREIGTRDLITGSVANPSEAAKVFAVEKAVRSAVLEHYSSQNSADPEKLQYPGSLTIDLDGLKIQASISGLQSDEDAVASLILLAHYSGWSVKACIDHIQERKGELPVVIFEPEHYLRKVLVKYNLIES